MDRIRNRIIWFCAAFVFFAAGIPGRVLKIEFLRPEGAGALLLWSLLSAGFLFLLVREWFRYKSAKLIVENGFLCIQAASLETERPGISPKITAGPTVIISCFGVLMENRPIQFNRNQIELREVKITTEHIYLSFGAKGKTQKLMVLHGVLDESQRSALSEQFIFETGVTPVTD